jgi:hypothetical protein
LRVLTLVFSLLTARSSCVNISVILSLHFIVDRCFQGSVLQPLPFNAFTNNVCSVITQFIFILFAVKVVLLLVLAMIAPRYNKMLIPCKVDLP